MHTPIKVKSAFVSLDVVSVITMVILSSNGWLKKVEPS